MINIPEVTQEIKTKTSRLEKWAAKVEQAQKVMVEAAQRGDFEAFSEDQVRYYLSHSPDMIAEAGLYLAGIQRDADYADMSVKFVWAEVWDQCNRERETLNLTNAKDREAWVLNHPKYRRALATQIEWKNQLNQMKVVYERYEHLFVATRKLASLMEKDNENNYRREKYNE